MPSIHDLIEHFGGTQKALADAVGVSQPTVNAWKKGTHGMRSKHAIRVEELTQGKFRAADFCPDLAEYRPTA